MMRTIRKFTMMVAALCLPAADAGAGPAEAAVAYLEKIAAREVNLEVGGDTAISPHVGAPKQREIAARIQRMALDLNGGELEAGEMRVDGDLAAAIVHKSEGYDPAKVAAFAVALIAVEDTWVPAPVLASFENTGVTLDFDARRRAAELERWMLRERALAHGRLQDQQTGRMRRDISRVLTSKQLAAMDVGELGRTFLEASTAGDQMKLFGLLGGLAETLPGDWGRRMEVVGMVTADDGDGDGAWRALRSQEVLRAIVSVVENDEDGFFEIGYLDPAADVRGGRVPDVELLQIGAARDANGLWRVDLPDRLMAPTGREGLRNRAAKPDPELQKRFPEKLRQAQPATPQDTPEALWEQMGERLKLDAPGEVIRLLSLPEDDPEATREALGRAVRFWWQLAVGDGGREPVRLAFQQVGDEALVMVQLFAFREPDRTDLRALHLVRGADGWLWNSTNRRQAKEVIHPNLLAWRDTEVDTWRDRWNEPLLEPVVRLESLDPGRMVAAADAEAAARNLLDAIAAGDLDAAMARCAVLDDADGHARLLRNLGYEFSTRLTDVEGGMTTRVGKHWTVVAFRRAGDVNPGMALLPVLATQDGPRILMELDLFVGTRQRDFLNDVALERLAGYAPAEVEADLRSILRQLNREFAPGRKR